MRELTSAIVRLPWATSLFAVDQMALVLGGEGRDGLREASANLYRATRALEEQLGDLLWATYQIGDAFQRSAIDLVCDAMDPRRWELAMSQLQNNLEVFNLVKGVRTVLHIPERDVFALAGLVHDAYALGDYPDLWAIEGLGHDYADRFWDRNEPVTGILQNEQARAIPRSSLTMLHAGIGLSFATHLLKDASPYDPAERWRHLARTFLSLVGENSWPGYEGAARESLGLVARTWHPQTVTPLDAALREVDENAREFFWHGAGRALYFHPLYIVPGLLSPWRAIDHEAPDETARLNMKAGLAWATILVNIRQPAILEHLLRGRGDDLAADDAFAAGVASAIVMARDITPHDRFIDALCADAVDRGAAVDVWEPLIAAPCRSASRVQPVLADADLLGEVFRHHAYPEWFDGVAATPARSGNGQASTH
jgi:hypothetical protein